MQLSADQVKALRAPFAPKRVKFRVLSLKTRDEQGRVQLARYVTTDDMTDRLDEVLPGQWSNIFDVTRYDGRGVPVEAKAAILIGDIRREALGAAAPDNYDQAMQAKSVDTDGFKRAAYRCGVASYLRTLRPCWWRIAGKAPNAAELVALRTEYAELVGMTADGDLLSADDFDDEEGETPTFGDDANATETTAPTAKAAPAAQAKSQTAAQPARASTSSTPATSSTAGPDLTRPDFFAAAAKLGLNPKEALDRLGVRSVAGLNLRTALATLERISVGRAIPGDQPPPSDEPDGEPPRREGPPMSRDDRITSASIRALKADIERQGRVWSDVCAWIPTQLKSGHTIDKVTYAELPAVRSWLDLDPGSAGVVDETVGARTEVGAPA
jgi:hypothetical protein